MGEGDELPPPARILIVDDESDAIDLLRRVLDRPDVMIASTTEPREALRLFEEFQPDLVLLDLVMPDIDGLQVLRQLRGKIPEGSYLPILVVTGHPDMRRAALAGGASDLIAKPYDKIEIELRTRNLLQTRFLHQQLAREHAELDLRVLERTHRLTGPNTSPTLEIAQQGQAQVALDAWEQTFDAIPHHVSILDLSGRILRASRAMRERFEPIHGNLVGLEYRVCYCGTAMPEAQPPCATVLIDGRPVSTEGPLPAVEGWFRVSAYPLLDRAGVQWGAVLIVMNETARRQAEATLRLAHEELQASRARNEFLARMSHEFRTPLNAILGFGDLLDVPGRPPEEAENIRQIVTAGRHLLNLVDSLLDVSRIEESSLTPQVATISPMAPSGAGSPEGQHSIVLYIEDNMSNLRLMRRVLARRPGVALLHTAAGQRGVELAREHRPDLVLLDLHLPDLTGDQVLAQLLCDPVIGQVPVVIVSADATAATSERLLAAGARAFLLKPLDVGLLLSVVDRFTALPDQSPVPVGEIS